MKALSLAPFLVGGFDAAVNQGLRVIRVEAGGQGSDSEPDIKLTCTTARSA